MNSYQSSVVGALSVWAGVHILAECFPPRCPDTTQVSLLRNRVRAVFEKVCCWDPALETHLKVSLYDNLHWTVGLMLLKGKISLANLDSQQLPYLVLLPLVLSSCLHIVRLVTADLGIHMAERSLTKKNAESAQYIIRYFISPSDNPV